MQRQQQTAEDNHKALYGLLQRAIIRGTPQQEERSLHPTENTVSNQTKAPAGNQYVTTAT
jgi:hypothetical protein